MEQNGINFEPVTVRREMGQNIFTVSVADGETPEGEAKILSAELPPGCWRRDLIISAIIRMKYSADAMEAIAMNVLADVTNADARNEHRALQQWRKKAKSLATEIMQWASDHGLAAAELSPAPEPEQPDTSIEETDGIATVSAAVAMAKDQALELPDEKALDVAELFPLWADNVGNVLHVDERYRYQNRLWKVLQEHTVQADWTPDVVPALFTQVVVQSPDEPEIGTLDNPIPYDGNMALEEGKYYSQDGVTYRCIRDTGNPVYHDLSDLVGLYVQVVE